MESQQSNDTEMIRIILAINEAHSSIKWYVQAEDYGHLINVFRILSRENIHPDVVRHLSRLVIDKEYFKQCYDL